MSNKKSFVLHKDSLAVLDKLTDEQAGKLFKAISNYQRGIESDLDPMTDIVFAPFEAQFSRDNEKWEKVSKARAEAGKKGGKQKQANLANASNCKQNLANLAVSVSDSVSVSERVSVSESDNNTSPPNPPKGVGKPDANIPKFRQRYEEDGQAAFDYWITKMGKRRASTKLCGKRIKLIEWGLENYGLRGVQDAIEGCYMDDWYMGANDRKKPFNGLEHILKGSKETEGFIEMYHLAKEGRLYDRATDQSVPFGDLTPEEQERRFEHAESNIVDINVYDSTGS